MRGEGNKYQLPTANSQQLVDAAREVIASSLATAAKPCITSSFQAECVVLTHMLLEEQPDIPVLFVDTFTHFPQTLAYRDELTERFKLNLINLRAKEPQVGLWERESTQACCCPRHVDTALI